MTAENTIKLQNSPPLEPKFRRRAIFAWTGLLGYAAFIDLTLSTVPTWREWLLGRFGVGVFANITYGAAAILLGLALGVMIFRKREKNIVAYLSLIAVLFFLRHIMRHWITIPVEQIHFVEYGIMGFLAYTALKYHLQGLGLVVAALLLTHFFGMIDECIQGNLANRVGEQRDMYWNGLAGLLGMAVVVLSLKPKEIRAASGRKEWAALLMMAALCLPVQGYFNSAIAQFGKLIQDRDLKVSFRSRLSAEELQRYNRDLEHFRSEIAPKIGRAKMSEMLPLVRNKIHEEALVHIFRFRRYFSENLMFVAFKELEISNKYFTQFLQGTPLEPPAEQIARLSEVVGDSARVLYVSPVSAHLITKFREWQMWMIIVLAEAGIFVYFVRYFRARREHPDG